MWKPIQEQVNWSGASFEEMKVEIIFQALSYNSGNKSKTSIVLGVSLRTVKNYVKRYDRLKIFRVSSN